jgi:hypothetical protein
MGYAERVDEAHYFDAWNHRTASGLAPESKSPLRTALIT